MIDLPETIATAFDGQDLATKVGVSALLATVDEDGSPHVSFLSVGEVLVAGSRVAVTLWGGAGSVVALTRNHRGVLFAVADGAVSELRLTVDEIRASDAPTVIALCHVAAMREHRAPYAEVAGLIDFALRDPPAAVARWSAQVAAMTAALG